MNIFQVLSLVGNLKNNPIDTLLQLALSVGAGKLEPAIEKYMKNKLSSTGRANIADQVSTLADDLRKGDNAGAASILVSLLEGIR